MSIQNTAGMLFRRSGRLPHSEFSPGKFSEIMRHTPGPPLEYLQGCSLYFEILVGPRALSELRAMSKGVDILVDSVNSEEPHLRMRRLRPESEEFSSKCSEEKDDHETRDLGHSHHELIVSRDQVFLARSEPCCKMQRWFQLDCAGND